MSGFGAYGKIPALGDFFNLNLSPNFIAPWDAFLQARLRSNQAMFASHWDRAYMSAPIWRFTLARDVAGPMAVLGILMPSVDRVGRKFPLTLAAQFFDEIDVAASHATAETVFSQLEDIALDALEDDMTTAQLAASLAQVQPITPIAGHDKHRSFWTSYLDGEAFQFAASGLPGKNMTYRFFDPARVAS